MPREVIFMGRPYKCPYCGQSESVSKGVRKTKSMGDRRIRLCKSCSRKYTPKIQKGSEDLPEATAVPDAGTAISAAAQPGDSSPLPVGEPAASAPAGHVPPSEGSADGKPG